MGSKDLRRSDIWALLGVPPQSHLLGFGTTGAQTGNSNRTAGGSALRCPTGSHGLHTDPRGVLEQTHG